MSGNDGPPCNQEIGAQVEGEVEKAEGYPWSTHCFRTWGQLAERLTSRRTLSRNCLVYVAQKEGRLRGWRDA